MASDPNAQGGLTAASDYVQIYIIDIDIKGARNLVKADLMGKSDPYCKISALGRSFTTQTILKTLDPDWNEHTQFCFFDDPGTLKFEVVDWDSSFNNDPIGDVDFNLAGFFDPAHAGFDGSVDLQNVKSGSLLLGIQCRRLVPSELEERCANLQDTLEEQRREIMQKTQRNANKTNENAQQTAANVTAQNELTDLNKQNADIQAQIEALQKEIETLQEENKQAESEIEGAQTALREAEGKQEELDQEIADLRRTCDEVSTENEGIGQQIQDTDARIREAEQAKREKEENQRLLDQAKSDEAPAIVAEKPTPAGKPTSASSSSKRVEPDGDNEPQGCNCNIL